MRDRILTTAEKLFLRYGIKSVSVDDIAGSIGVSKRTLYQHISTKEEIVQDMLHELRTETSSQIDLIREETIDAVEAMFQIATYILRVFKDMNPRIIYDLRKYYHPIYLEWEQFHQQHVYDVIRENLERGRKDGLYREDFNIDVVARFYMVKALMLVDEVYFDFNKITLAELIIEHLKYHFRGVCTIDGLIRLQQLTEKYPHIPVATS